MKRLIVLLLIATTALGSISTTTQRVSYTGDASDTTFDFTFPIVNTSDLQVYLRTTSTGAETLQTETTHYSLSATNNDYSGGGTVTMVTAPAATEELFLVRATPETQETTLSDSGILRLSSIENALDKLTRIVQDHTEEFARCLKIPPSDATSITTEADDSVSRASTYLYWDDGGDLSTAAGVTASDVTVSAYGETLVDDANAPFARVTLGFLNNTFWNAFIADANSTEAQSTLGMLDEDTLASDSASFPPSQQSVKAYVDASVLSAVIDINAAEIKALNASPMELVAAGGANTLIEFVSATLILEYGSEVLAEPSAPDDLAIEYDDGTGTQIVTWDTTGFITNNADAMEIVNSASVGGGASAIGAATNVNKNIALVNTGGEYTGNASGDTTIKVYVTYRLHTSLDL
jgi:hypothetical protein